MNILPEDVTQGAEQYIAEAIKSGRAYDHLDAAAKVRRDLAIVITEDVAAGRKPWGETVERYRYVTSVYDAEYEKAFGHPSPLADSR